MIIWISSYPKSGNTYLRSFISSYFFSKKGKFDFNREIIEEIQNKKFDNSKFNELVGYGKEYGSINSVNDNNLFEILLY